MQRDEATMIAFRAALEFQNTVGRAAIEQRARDLTTQLMEGLRKLPGVTVWTSTCRSAVPRSCRGCRARWTPARSRPHYGNDGIAVATRGGRDRSGIRNSPHLYNSPAEIDRLLAALRRYLKSGA